MFELISAMVRYFAGGIKERRSIGYWFRPPCVKRMWHRSYCKRFFGATNYQVVNVVNRISEESLDYFSEYMFAWNMIFWPFFL